MKTAIIAMAMSVLGFTAQAQQTTSKNSKTLVLVHGAWADASAWDAVTPLVVDIFAADAPQQVQEYLAATVKAEPLVPLATPVHLTETNFGSIRKVYIHTENDHAISYPAQQYMVKNSKINKVYTLQSSHTPFISMPDKLAAILIAESK